MSDEATGPIPFECLNENALVDSTDDTSGSVDAGLPSVDETDDADGSGEGPAKASLHVDAAQNVISELLADDADRPLTTEEAEAALAKAVAAAGKLGLKSHQVFLLPCMLHCSLDLEVTGAVRAIHQICQLGAHLFRVQSPDNKGVLCELDEA